jgi:hypothetical protein
MGRGLASILAFGRLCHKTATTLPLNAVGSCFNNATGVYGIRVSAHGVLLPVRNETGAPRVDAPVSLGLLRTCRDRDIPSLQDLLAALEHCDGRRRERRVRGHSVRARVRCRSIHAEFGAAVLRLNPRLCPSRRGVQACGLCASRAAIGACGEPSGRDVDV